MQNIDLYKSLKNLRVYTINKDRVKDKSGIIQIFITLLTSINKQELEIRVIKVFLRARNTW